MRRKTQFTVYLTAEKPWNCTKPNAKLSEQGLFDERAGAKPEAVPVSQRRNAAFRAGQVIGPKPRKGVPAGTPMQLPVSGAAASPRRLPGGGNRS